MADMPGLMGSVQVTAAAEAVQDMMGERQLILSHFEQSLSEAARIGIDTARVNTPYVTGDARKGWVLNKAGKLQYVIVNLDVPPKMRFLEGRHYPLKRAAFAADKHMAAKGYGAVQITPDFSPRW